MIGWHAKCIVDILRSARQVDEAKAHMPIKYRVYREKQLLSAILTGNVSSLEMLNYLRKIRSEPDSDKLDRLVTFEDIKDFMSGQQIGNVAIYENKLFPQTGNRIALVASSDAEYGLSRQYQLYRDHPPDKLKVFRDFKEATEWLGQEGYTQEDQQAEDELWTCIAQ